MIMSPEAENFSSAISMSTTVSCPKASWDTQARKCRTMNSYTRPSLPFGKQNEILFLFWGKVKQTQKMSSSSSSPAAFGCTWWGVWEGGPDLSSCPAVGWDLRAGQAPAERRFPRLDFVSAAPPADRGPRLEEKCWSLFWGSWWTWAG